MKRKLQIGNKVRLEVLTIADISSRGICVEEAVHAHGCPSWFPFSLIEEVILSPEEREQELRAENEELRRKYDDLLKANSILLGMRVQDKLGGKS